MSYDREGMVSLILAHEGERLKPYKCTQGYLTIGVGRNLDTRGITQEESRFLLSHDLEQAEHDARIYFHAFDFLTDARKMVLIDMAFNLGLAGLLRFKKLQAALERQDFSAAAKEMLDSRWATQVGQRAITLATMMETGELR